jgi:flagellar protein FliO/FliZ
MRLQYILGVILVFLSSITLASDKEQNAVSHGPVLDTTAIFSWFISTFAIIMVIFLMAYLIKKSRFVKVNRGSLAIENQLYVGPKQRVVMIRAGSKKMLLGVTQTNITYLCSLEDPKLEFEKIMQSPLVKEQETVEDKAEGSGHA